MCGLVLLDLQTAFDTVDHGILISKLKAFGMNDASLSWVASYLSGRDQQVEVAR